MSNSTTSSNTSSASTSTPESTKSTNSSATPSSAITTTPLCTASMMQHLLKKYGWDDPRNSPNRVAYTLGTEYSYYERNYETPKQERQQAPPQVSTDEIEREKIDVEKFYGAREGEKTEQSEAAKEVGRILRKYEVYTKK